jgi:hypothetical protein
MPYKDPELRKRKNREYHRKWYQKNKKKHISTSYRNKKKHKRKWVEFKKSLCCEYCGYSHFAVIDFHHIDKKDKKNVNQLVKDGLFKQAYEEIKKCIPLCANCHRILHYEEKQKMQRECCKLREIGPACYDCPEEERNEKN